MIIGWLELVIGLLILIVGGEFLVRSAVKLAIYLNVSSLVIGLTIVSFGTSFPELVVSLNAAVGGYPDISLGNVVGSNIANLALVLGLTAAIFPIAVDRSSVLFDWPLMLIASIALVVFSLDGRIETWEGIILFVTLIIYNVWIIRNSRKQRNVDVLEEVEGSFKRSTADLIRTVLFLALSMLALVFGADLLVDGAVKVAVSFGLEERVIALSIIAFGTSAPELATSLVAVYRKETSISVGNLIGSNIFNILGILGITAALSPIDVNERILSFDYYWMIGIPLLLLPFLITRMKLSRIEGVLLFLAYLTYIYLLF